MDLDKAIKSRRSVRKYKSREPDWRDIIECIDAARYAPMAGNIYTLKFILVHDEEKIQKIAQACQQPFVNQAQYLVVVCSNPKRTLNAYGKMGETFVHQQAGAAIQNFLLKIVEKGLSTCWIGYFVEKQIKNILKIKEEMQIEALFPIGYELAKPLTKKAKIELDNILFFDEQDNKRMKPIRKIDT